MNRLVRNLLSSFIAISVVLAPTAAGASDENTAFALNRTDGAALAQASVDYRKASNGVVDEENRAYAIGQCVDCQTLAVAFQLVLVTKPPSSVVPVNKAYAVNQECDGCVTWASAKQIVVETGGPAALSESGHNRMKALERSVEALEDQMPSMTVEQLAEATDAAYQEFLDIALTEVVRTDGRTNDAKVVATRSA